MPTVVVVDEVVGTGATGSTELDRVVVLVVVVVGSEEQAATAKVAAQHTKRTMVEIFIE